MAVQTSLFDEAIPPDQAVTHDLGDALIQEYPHAFPSTVTNSLLRQLLESIPWQQETIRIAGRMIDVPRLQCWMGDRASCYGYSGIRLQPISWTPLVQSIRERVESLTSERFNSVLLNYYRNGQDSVAWHADDEPELGPAPLIASVSFGAQRQFQFRPKQRESAKTPQKFQMLLRDGSIIVMGNTVQNKWMHQLPKEKNLDLPRVNLTFRNII